ncbi:MAG TPA: hypothetical protein VKE40_05960, partial [Gemmataceae bacterium]|nr:hypothetical protein [Gemmataceae bacterium]
PRVVPPPAECPPVPRPPTVPPTVPPVEPTVPPEAVAPRAPEAGGLAASTFNPNMFGDRFGGSGTSTAFRTLNFTILRADGTSFAHYDGVVNPPRFVPSDSFPTDFPAVIRIDGGTITVGRPVFMSSGPIAPTAGVITTNQLLENSQVTSLLRGRFPGAIVQFVNGTATEKEFLSSGFVEHQIDQVYDLFQGQVALPLPSSGGTVGRTRLSDDNNPLPRDRLIFNWDYFEDATVSPNGFDIHRFSVGVEKTFLDQWASVEVRLPFASTLDSTVGSDGTIARDTEIGNLFTALKVLMIRGDVFNMSAGVAVNWPTAEDTRLRGVDGRELIVIENRSYIVSPFVAMLFTPNDRLFAQAWVHGDIDVTGSPVFTNFDGRGRIHVGDLRDQRLLTTDLQVGYWIIRNDSRHALRGLAPFIEAHYTTTLTSANQVTAGNGFLVGASDRRYDEINVTTGITALFSSNLMLTAGLVIPVGGTGDRFFDYQFGVRANWFFGPTARDMTGFPYADGYGAPAELAGAAPPVTGTEPGVIPPGMPAAVPPAGAAARAPEAGGVAPSTFNPNFFGDQIGVLGTRTSTTTATSRVQIPILPRYVGLKPTDNDGPRPQDRAFFSYNYYSGVNASVNPAGSPSIHLDRELIGLETTLGTDASIGARLPFLQSGGDPNFTAHDVSDLTIVGKYAVFNDPATGNAVTLGLTVTVPTGVRGGPLGTLDNGQSAPRAVFVQPWAGVAWADGDLFAQGVTSLLLPTDPIYPAVWFNSVGVGYWLYRNASDALVQGVAPVVELHVNTPLTNREEETSVIFFRDQVNLTGGLYVQFPRLALGGAVCVPLAGPRPYNMEAMLSLNFQF